MKAIQTKHLAKGLNVHRSVQPGKNFGLKFVAVHYGETAAVIFRLPPNDPFISDAQQLVELDRKWELIGTGRNGHVDRQDLFGGR